ncbi:porin [Paraburkholderia sp. J41]|uniref:porin n=1 Tax=Paraburkholderia sp. J41 TaxID=2805433 RepID=UPI002AC3710E|nr:porin [Paraburkholderia sp. J41]
MRCCVIGLALATSEIAQAQTSVTLYGIIDTGIDYASNVAQVSNVAVVQGSGAKLVQESSGVPLGSRWGLHGVEDLGGGLNVIFTLESGFSSVNGALGATSTLFSRNAFVGLSSAQYGTVTFGKQWDAIVDDVESFTLNGNLGGWYFSHPNDMDNTDNGFSINNDVKYVSPSVGGLKAEAHYSFGGQAGQYSNDSSYGGGLSYSSGAFGAGAAYLRVNNPETAVAGYQSGGGYLNSVYGDALAQARSQQIVAVGAAYHFDAFQLLGDFTNVVFQQGDAGRNVVFQNYEISGIYTLTPAWTLAGGYTYTTGRDHETGEEPKYQQINLLAQYAFSKRTALYLMAALQRALGSARYAQIAGFNPSGTDQQAVVRLGLTHHF